MAQFVGFSLRLMLSSFRDHPQVVHHSMNKAYIEKGGGGSGENLRCFANKGGWGPDKTYFALQKSLVKPSIYTG